MSPLPPVGGSVRLLRLAWPNQLTFSKVKKNHDHPFRAGLPCPRSSALSPLAMDSQSCRSSGKKRQNTKIEKQQAQRRKQKAAKKEKRKKNEIETSHMKRATRRVCGFSNKDRHHVQHTPHRIALHSTTPHHTTPHCTTPPTCHITNTTHHQGILQCKWRLLGKGIALWIESKGTCLKI